jgi:hypothetical protein
VHTLELPNTQFKGKAGTVRVHAVPVAPRSGQGL